MYFLRGGGGVGVGVGVINFSNSIHFRFKGCLVVFFILIQFLMRLIWLCTVCLCPTKKTLGVYGLSIPFT